MAPSLSANTENKQNKKNRRVYLPMDIEKEYSRPAEESWCYTIMPFFSTVFWLII